MSATIHTGACANDTARMLCILHQVAEAAHDSISLDDQVRPHNIVDGSLGLADWAHDDNHAREHLLYIAAQAVAWLLVIERRRAF